MTFDPTPPQRGTRLTLKIDAIGNGYLISPEARPSMSDPMGERGSGPPLYVREIEDAPAALAFIIEQAKEAERVNEEFRRSLRGERQDDSE